MFSTLVFSFRRLIVDATYEGGIAKFVNASCDPNAVILTTDDPEKRIFLFAARDIAADEEISYDYLFDCAADGEVTVCCCGKKSCRGYF